MAKSPVKQAVRPSRLGRGLSSLMTQTPAAVPVGGQGAESQASPQEGVAPGQSQDSPSSPEDQIARLPLKQLRPNPTQPRRSFDQASLENLAESIRTTGVMQPVIVRPTAGESGYEIVAGERRWRAAEKAGLDTIPAIVRELDDRQTSEWALIENLQREDLNPIDRAEAFQRLTDRYEIGHEQIAERIGVDRSTITNTMRLLALDGQVQEVVRTGQLSISQAKVLLGLTDHREAQRALARKAVKEQWSVRRIEAEVKKLAEVVPEPSPGAEKMPARAPYMVDLERQITESLGTKVRLRPGKKKGSGSLTIDFYSIDHFAGLMERFGVETEGV